YTDVDEDGELTDVDPVGVLYKGSFNVTLDAINNAGTFRIVPAPPFTNAKANSPNDWEFCFDIATLLPETLPLVAPKPSTCAVNVTISPLSSVMAYGGLTQDQMRAAFDLPNAVDVGSYNGFSAAMDGKALGQHVISQDIVIKSAVLVGLSALKASADNYT
ncbi:hypothetical protein H632_c4719p0, partial [Helicosporidium sp. ATCC 50920]